MDLFEQWTTLDDRALAKNPISIRLPIHMMARLAALSELFPNKTRSELMVDLMKAALEQFEEGSFPVKDFPEYRQTGGQSLHHALGMQYRKLSNKHYKQLAKESGNKNLAELFPAKEGK